MKLALGHSRWSVRLLLAALLLVPLFVRQEYFLHILIMAGIYVILTLSLNLVTGIAGQLSLGQVAFYGIGAYASALLALRLGLPVYLSMPLGGLIAAFFGFLLGVPTLRLSGIYLGIATMGFAEIARLVFLNWYDLTRGPMGLPGIPSLALFGITFDTPAENYYVAFFLCAVTYVVLDRVVKSRTGLAFVAIREDEIAARSMGLNVFRYKVMAFAGSAFFAGIAGAFYAHFITFISPASFTSAESFLVLSMYIMGGEGSLPGSVLGASILSLAPELLRSVSDYRMIIYGLLLVVLIIFKPEGLAGLLKPRPVAGGAGVVPRTKETA